MSDNTNTNNQEDDNSYNPTSDASSEVPVLHALTQDQEASMKTGILHNLTVKPVIVFASFLVLLTIIMPWNVCPQPGLQSTLTSQTYQGPVLQECHVFWGYSVSWLIHPPEYFGQFPGGGLVVVRQAIPMIAFSAAGVITLFYYLLLYKKPRVYS